MAPIATNVLNDGLDLKQKSLACLDITDPLEDAETQKHEINGATPNLGILPATMPFLRPSPALFITGLGSQYPPFTFKPERLEPFLGKWYDTNTPAMKKLFQVNQTTMIKSRSSIKHPDDPSWSRSDPPSIAELDRFVRKAGVDLTVQACKKALRDAKLRPNDITHLVAVTCTNAGNPGIDLLVAQKLKLKPETDRTLLHGVGCAGGLSALRAASSMAQSYSVRGRPARVLVFACEICSVNVRCDMEEMLTGAAEEGETKISPVLFSDAAASFVLCNELVEGVQEKGVYEVVDWETSTIPNTAKELEFMVDPIGFRATLTRRVPLLAQEAIGPMFERLRPFLRDDSALAETKRASKDEILAKDFDWALHPGGIAILNGVQTKFDLREEQLRASFDVYQNHGNSSSPTVLVVLDTLRKMGEGRENVMACSFGPGMTVEMAMLKRVRHTEDE